MGDPFADLKRDLIDPSPAIELIADVRDWLARALTNRETVLSELQSESVRTTLRTFVKFLSDQLKPGASTLSPSTKNRIARERSRLKDLLTLSEVLGEEDPARVEYDLTYLRQRFASPQVFGAGYPVPVAEVWAQAEPVLAGKVSVG